MFAEDLSLFFDDPRGFSQAASWGALTAQVIFDMPTEDILSGRAQSDEYQAILARAAWPGIARGASVSIAGQGYTVREVRILDDGALKALTLTRS